MNATSTAIAYEDTGYFSSLILDYLRGKKALQSFYAHPVSIGGIKASIEKRKIFPTNRKLLTDVLQKHYTNENATTRQLQNIKLLANNNCFTITTAHQPNIFTGHLYFVYKILHAIKLCEKLKDELPENDFIPVFYMGSEDADLEELGHVYFNGNKHEWKTTQTGAVGRMKVDKALVQMLNDFEGEITVYPYGREIIEQLKACYIEGTTIEQATFKLLNILFGEYGLIVLLPDDADYKRAFIPVAEKELKEQFSYPFVEDTVARLSKEYKVQAGGRELNMFFLKGDMRERIVKKNSAKGSTEKFIIQHSTLEFDAKGITDELNNNPERFSPNVILRPVFQEMILPNIAFIGGGGEIAYWLELKQVFESVNIPFPVLILRNSFLLVEKKQSEKIKKSGFSLPDVFKPESELINMLVKRDSTVQLSLQKEKQAIRTFYAELKVTAGAVDTTLQPHIEALEKLALRKLDALEKKMLRAEKKKFEAQQRQLHKLKEQLFPHENLQERIENFIPFYAKWGSRFVHSLYSCLNGLEQEFVILEEA
jgi:bacillithiol biosynthesis cysteine-adding enzyme BshC